MDLLRGDYLSAGLDLAGAIPFAGEFADTARLAMLAGTIKRVDKVSDAAKVAKKASKISSVADNAKSVAKKYNLNKNGFFGEQGKNARIFKSSDPLKSSADFYNKISKGGVKSTLSNGKGVQTLFDDNSRVIYRVITKTPDSPAVSISVTNPGKIKPQKIHFIRSD